MPLTRRLTQPEVSKTEDAGEVAQAAKWLQQAEAILICAGNLFTLESDAGGPFRQPPLTKTEGLEYGIPAPGSWNPIRALWHEHVQLDSAKLFESDAALAWAFWGFWCKCYLENVPNDFYRWLGTWACSRSKGYFCVTDDISGHWPRILGEEKTWELFGAVSHLQRTDGEQKVWRVGETRMSLTTQRIVTGISSQMNGMRDGFSMATSALTSFLDPSPKPASSKLNVNRKDSEIGQNASRITTQQQQSSPNQSAADLIKFRLAQPVSSLEITVPVWNLRPGEVVEVRTREPVENSSKYQWSAWHRAVVGEDGFSVISNGLPIRAHSIRRLKGEDLLRVDGELPMDPEDSSSLARPNVSMSGDTKFTTCRSDRQEKAFYEWLQTLPSHCRLVLVEVGLQRTPQEVLQAQHTLRGFRHAKMIRIGCNSSRPLSNHSCRIFGTAHQALQKLMEEMGEPTAEVAEVQEMKAADLDTFTSVASEMGAEPNIKESSEHKDSTVSGRLSKEVGSDGLMHWDEIEAEETDHVQSGNAFGQILDMASGIFAVESEDESND